MEKFNLDWETYLQLISQLISQLEPEKFTCLIGIGRGGLIPATIISHRLNIPMGCIFVESYDDKNNKIKPVVSSLSSNHLNLEKVIIVDDICDSGETLVIIKNFFKKEYKQNIQTSTIFLSKRSQIQPDYYIQELDDNIWVNFPYEKVKIIVNNE